MGLKIRKYLSDQKNSAKISNFAASFKIFLSCH